MKQFVVLAGPTLDQALGLVRLGLIETSPTETRTLNRGACTGSSRFLVKIRETAPDELKPLLCPTTDHPVHLYVPDPRDVHRGSIAHHVMRGTFPEGSFLELCEGILVPSWPLYYVIRCRLQHDLSSRMMLGMELCGSYGHLTVGDQSTATFFRKPHRNASGELIVNWGAPPIDPVLHVSDLEDYLHRAKGIKGLHRAREAGKYLLDGSASPGESVLALMTTLPCRLGGYGFANLELNKKIEVPTEMRHLTRADAYHPDGYLKTLDFDLEYESNLMHTGAKAVAHDKARRNDIQALGIEVKDVTWEMLSHLDSLDLLFEQVLDKERRRGLGGNGKHIREVRHPDNKAARKTRLQELLPKWPYEA